MLSPDCYLDCTAQREESGRWRPQAIGAAAGKDLGTSGSAPVSAVGLMIPGDSMAVLTYVSMPPVDAVAAPELAPDAAQAVHPVASPALDPMREPVLESAFNI
jgi:hypothetical protein